MPYPEEMVKPMREELTREGFNEFRTPDDVEEFFSDPSGTSLVVINSVCGCAAGSARPGAVMSLKHEIKPDNLLTVFAGQDLEATDAVRGKLENIPPSSPSMALFKDGELVHFIPRHFIEMCDANRVAAELCAAYDKFFAAGAEA